jgi:hypothetical protein
MGFAERAPELWGGIMKGCIDFTESEIDGDYDRWLDSLTEASTRLDALETAVNEVRCLCESRASNEQILEVFDRLGV